MRYRIFDKTDVHSLPDIQLLSLIFGDDAEGLYNSSGCCLRRTIQEASAIYHHGCHALLAANELIIRALHEDIVGDELTSPHRVREYLTHRCFSLEHEIFFMLSLDAQHRLLSVDEMSRGSIASAAIHPREIVKRAMAVNAAAVIFSHNHPSGSPIASPADISLTNTLKSALALVDVRVLDHLIVAGHRITSMAEHGLL